MSHGSAETKLLVQFRHPFALEFPFLFFSDSIFLFEFSMKQGKFNSNVLLSFHRFMRVSIMWTNSSPKFEPKVKNVGNRDAGKIDEIHSTKMVLYSLFTALKYIPRYHYLDK